jgi:hypothetical protein
LEATSFTAEISPNGDPRLTPYLLKGFLYENFNNFSRKIGDVWRVWGRIFFMVDLGIIT